MIESGDGILSYKRMREREIYRENERKKLREKRDEKSFGIQSHLLKENNEGERISTPPFLLRQILIIINDTDCRSEM